MERATDDTSDSDEETDQGKCQGKAQGIGIKEKRNQLEKGRTGKDMTDNEQSKHEQNMFVRAIIETQQQQEIYERRKKKQENEKAKNSWKTENSRRKEVKTTAGRTTRQGTTRVGTEGRGHLETD